MSPGIYSVQPSHIGWGIEGGYRGGAVGGTPAAVCSAAVAGSVAPAARVPGKAGGLSMPLV